MLFGSGFDNSIRLQKDIRLETRPSPLAQNDHLKLKLSLCCRFVMKRKR